MILFAGMFGFKDRPYFEAEAGRRSSSRSTILIYRYYECIRFFYARRTETD